jgi:hypothetical protein
MTLAKQIKTLAFWLRCAAILVSMLLIIVVITLISALVMSPITGPWVALIMLVVLVGWLAYDIGKD